MNFLFKNSFSGIKTLTTTGLLSVSLLSISNAAIIFAEEGFESGLGDWNVGSRGSVSGNNDTGLYNFNSGGTPVNSPTGADAANGNVEATTINYATTGDGAFRLENGFATLESSVFDASKGGAAESITLSFDLTRGYRVQSTRFSLIEYSPDNGASWYRVAGFSNPVGSGSVTFSEDGTFSRTGVFNGSSLNRNLGGTGGTAIYTGQDFGSQSLIRVIFDSRNDNRSQFIDNIELTTTAVPEPSTTALIGLGGLALILRRRK